MEGTGRRLDGFRFCVQHVVPAVWSVAVYRSSRSRTFVHVVNGCVRWFTADASGNSKGVLFLWREQT